MAHIAGMPLEGATLLSGIPVIAAMIAMLIIIAFCVCREAKDKVHEYGTVGTLSIARDSLVWNEPGNGELSRPDSQKSLQDSSTTSDPSRNSWNLKERALPDPPHSSSALLNSTEGSPTYKSVENCSVKNKPSIQAKRKSRKPPAPQPPGLRQQNSLPTRSCSTSSGLVTPTDANVSPTSLPAMERRSMFDLANCSSLVSEQSHSPSHDIGMKNPLSDGRNKGDQIGTVTDVGDHKRLGETSQFNPPPVPVKHFDVTDQLSPESEASTSNGRVDTDGSNRSPSLTPAGLAVAGILPHPVIPYMTPPPMQQPSTESLAAEWDPGLHPSTSQHETSYTTISIREPLSKVREQTFQLRQNLLTSEETQVNSFQEGENHYVQVPEEEQTYAEIGSGSGHNSAGSSVTYAHIEPRELPPVPPTVESLKSVAYAHSRQASSISTSSLGSALSGSSEAVSPPPQTSNTNPIHSTVDKYSKQRRTIHVGEGVSMMSSLEKKKKVEDLYAKVHKRNNDVPVRNLLLDDTSEHHIDTSDKQTWTPPPSPWGTSSPPSPPPVSNRCRASPPSLPSTSTGIQGFDKRFSVELSACDLVMVDQNPYKQPLSGSINVDDSGGTAESDEAGYEKIRHGPHEWSADSQYEQIKYLDKVDPGYERVKQGNRSANSEDDPDYEKVKGIEDDLDSTDPGYESVKRLNNSDSDNADPGYEPLRQFDPGYDTVKMDEEQDPGYEVVRRGHSSENPDINPVYERIRRVHRAESDATDPGYERVRHVQNELNEPNYETVNRSESDIADSDYETVRHLEANTVSGESSPSLQGADLHDYARVKKKRNTSQKGNDCVDTDDQPTRSDESDGCYETPPSESCCNQTATSDSEVNDTTL